MCGDVPPKRVTVLIQLCQHDIPVGDRRLPGGNDVGAQCPLIELQLSQITGNLTGLGVLVVPEAQHIGPNSTLVGASQGVGGAEVHGRRHGQLDEVEVNLAQVGENDLPPLRDDRGRA